ncbi:MAG: hypothetical protein ACPLRA_07195, partial [Candidatus Saccharicenans sp.]
MKKKKNFISLLVGLGLIVSLILPLTAQPEKEILEKMINSLGGRKTLSEIKDTRISGTVEIIQYGMTAPMTIY